MTAQPTTATAFDLVAEQHWQDYLQNLPVAGGMAYESRVHACKLDESMDSLKRLDTLLALIQQELSEQAASTLMKQSSFRHFVLFLSFYAGRVINKNTRTVLCWQDFETLQAWFGVAPSFYTTTALCADKYTPPFFVLGVVLGAIFGQPLNHPVSQTPLPTNLYWAVQGYLDILATATLKADLPTGSPTAAIKDTPKLSVQSSNPTSNPRPTPNPSKTTGQPISPSPNSTKPPNPTTKPLSHRAEQKQAAKRLEFLNHFKEVKQDLKTMTGANTTYNEQYQKCAVVIDAVFDEIGSDMQAWQNLSPAKKQTLAKAQDALKKLAKAGNSNAQLLLSVCLFCGVGVAQNGALAVKLVQTAAMAGDVRAAKFLSRIYYQGLFVEPSTTLGEEWLDKAAMGGHAEAKKLKEQFAYVNALKEQTVVVAQKDKQFNLMLIGVGVVFLLAFWLMIKFLS